MYQRASLAAVAVASVGLLVAGCSSSSSSGSSAASPSPTSGASTPAASSSAAGGGAVSAADCAIIGPIASSAVAKLTPLSTEPKAQAEATLKAYLAQVEAADAKLTSAGGKKVLGAYITALEKSTTESTAEATTQMTAALGALGSACS
jgi:hypothetical protein